MRLFRTYEYRLSRQEDAGVLVRRVDEALAASQKRAMRHWFYFGDALEAKISACRRAVKSRPDLERYLFARSKAPTATLHLSNLLPPWAEANPNGELPDVSIGAWLEVSAGIPKRFPFLKATFLFDQVPWLGGAPREAPTPAAHHGGPLFAYSSCSGSAVMIRSDWWVSRRQVGLYSSIEIEPPTPAATTIGGLPQETTSLLAQLGKIHRVGLRIEYDATELSEFAIAKDQVSALRERYLGLLSGPLPMEWQLPFSLPAYEDANSRRPDNLSCLISFGTSPKATLLELFTPLGYRYDSKASGGGMYMLTKRTAQNHSLRLSFDRGNNIKQFHASLGIRGAGVSLSLPLPCTQFMGNCTAYPVLDADTWSQAAANVAEVLRRIETPLLTEFEAIVPPAPAWYEYGC
jgi:hypothetical protein